jgi:uncharacterized BrkB/YihY/UPF0761 family membrane protein
MNIGGPEFIVILVVAAIFLIFPLWSLVDATMRTDADFEAIGQSRGTWIILLLAGIVCFTILGAVLGLYYLLSVRPKLRGQR